MPCKRCGYILGPMDLECPECARLGAQQKSALYRAPAVTINKNWLQSVGKFQPPFDWPATILLSLTCFISAIAIFFWFFALILSQATAMTGETGHDLIQNLSHAFAGSLPLLCLLIMLVNAAKATGGIAFMFFKRWGFYLFVPSAALTALLNLVVGVHGVSLIRLILLLVTDLIPLYIACYVGKERLGEMD